MLLSKDPVPAVSHKDFTLSITNRRMRLGIGIGIGITPIPVLVSVLIGIGMNLNVLSQGDALPEYSNSHICSLITPQIMYISLSIIYLDIHHQDE